MDERRKKTVNFVVLPLLDVAPSTTAARLVELTNLYNRLPRFHLKQ
jgi:hypothetical protein